MPGEKWEPPDSFGFSLREARNQKKLSLKELSEKIPCSKGHLSKLENGKARVSPGLARACDEALDSGGRLIRAWHADPAQHVPQRDSRTTSVPFDVPPPPGCFVGRDAEADLIVGAIRGPQGGNRAPVVLIHGLGGVGKTALALHVAHRVRDRYPGGCLFVDFGLGPGSPSVHDWLLRRLGVPAEVIPAEPGEARARYLREACRRTMLVVADGVTSAGQVAALVPASSECAVIATSRRRLDALDDGLAVHLCPLAADDASALLRSASGRDDLGSDADLRRMAAACGGLPLALRVAAATARNSRRDAAQMASRLESPAAWRQLDDGERSVRRTLLSCFGALPESAGRTMATLALHPAEAIARYPAAWLAGCSPGTADDECEELLAHGLITVDPAGRARPHGLVRRLALEAAASLDEPSRRQAEHRLIAGYAKAAMTADGVMVPQRFRPGEAGGDIAVAPMSFGDPARAMEWCRAEAGVIPRLCELALGRGLYEECWRLAYAMRDYFFAAKEFGPWIESHLFALRGAECCGNQWALAVTHNNLGMAYVERKDQIAKAEAHYSQALKLQHDIKDHRGVATTLGHQAWANHAAGRHETAITLADEAIRLNRQHDNQRSVAIMYRTAALALSAIGGYGGALSRLDECEKVLSDLGLPLDFAMMLNCRGEVHHAMGDFDDAAEFHGQAAERAAACGGAGEQARAVRGKAAALAAAGSGTRHV